MLENIFYTVVSESYILYIKMTIVQGKLFYVGP